MIILAEKIIVINAFLIYCMQSSVQDRSELQRNFNCEA